jgi:TM2 domain-containing membrane protein YozV
MDLIFKKSHVYSCVLFCALSCGLASLCVARAAAGKLDWADVPALALLFGLGSGLVAIVINFAWLLIQEKAQRRQDEPRNYVFSHDTFYASATVMLFSVVVGLSQG